jgi:MYXO-CTERM domain-containing protein
LVFGLTNAAGSSQIESALNGTGTYIFSVSSFGGGYDATSITALGIGLQTLVGGSGGASMTFNSFTYAVPAPGALALLGVAGLVGGRRRRA